MNFFNLAVKNIRQSFKNYLTYFISTVFAVVVFYIFLSIYYNQQFMQMSAELSKLKVAFIVSAIVVAFFSVIFIWNSNSFFIKTRKKEIATYSLLGMTRRQIARMLFYENILMGIVALASGIMIGTLFSKLFAMALIYVVGEAVQIEFVIELKAVINTAIVFLGMFFINSVHGYTIIYRFKLADLFSAQKEGEKQPKSSWIGAIFSIILIGVGYALAVLSGGFVVILAVPILIIVITGTFLLFHSVAIALIKRIKKNKSYYYSGVNLISVSQLLYRIKGNVRTLATIAVLGAVTITAVGTTFTVYLGTEDMVSRIRPYSFSYIVKEEGVDKNMNEVLLRYPENQVKSIDEIYFIKVKGESSRYTSPEGTYYLMSESQYRNALENRNKKLEYELKDESECMGRADGSKAGEVTLSISSGMLNKKLTVAKPLREIPMNAATLGDIVVVKDVLYNDFRNTNPEIVTVRGYLFESPEKSGQLVKDLKQVIPKDQNPSDFYGQYSSLRKTTGVLAYIGAFLGILFVLSTGSIIYFKQLTEANDDRHRYVILQNIGVSKKEIRSAIAKQMKVVFGLPLLISICHSAFALTSLKNMLMIDIIGYCAAVAVAYAIAYAIYYFITVDSYVKIVERN